MPAQAPWNSELARACEARVYYHVSIGSSKEFMWRKAHATILAVEKDIKRQPSGRIINMPRLKEVTAQQELEAVIRGERPVVPPEMVEAFESPPDRNFDTHPYIKRMEYRGGGYAILMALHGRACRPRERQFAYKAELVREAQRFCDVSMLSSDGWARGRTCGWASHSSLLAHRLVVAGRGHTGSEEFRLTEDGRLFVEAMLRKWPLSDSISQAQRPPGQTPDAPAETLPASAPSPTGSVVEQQQVPESHDDRESRTSPSPPSLQSRAGHCHGQQFVEPAQALSSSMQEIAASARRMPEVDVPSEDPPIAQTLHLRSSLGSACRSRSPRRFAVSDGRHRGFETEEASQKPHPQEQLSTASQSHIVSGRHAEEQSLLGMQSESLLSEAQSLQARPPHSDAPPRKWLRNSLKVRPRSEDDGCDHQRICSVPTPFRTACDNSQSRVHLCGAKQSPEEQTHQVHSCMGNEGIVEVSSDEELVEPFEPAEALHQDSLALEPSARAFQQSDGAIPQEQAQRPATLPVRILIDDRERLRDVDPRGIFDRVTQAVKEFGTASRRRLRFGDFMWASGEESCPNDECTALGCIIERKRVADLVGRSAAGAHIRQLERLETCGLPHPFLLIEGNPKHASGCPVYDEHAHVGESRTDAIRCDEDIDELCARMLVTQSRVGMIATKDIEGTARLLGHITAWLAATQPLAFSTCSSSGPLRDFEAQAVARAELRDEFAQRLRSAGVPAEALEALRRRFGSLADARESLLSCSDPAHRCQFFDFAAVCSGVGERICTALGVQVPLGPPTPSSEPTPRRTVRINASRALLQRLPAASSDIVLVEARSVSPSDLSCEMVVSAGERCSERLVVVALPGHRLLEVILAEATRLGAGTSPVALARAASRAFTAFLPVAPVGRRMVVLEGVRLAVRSAAHEAAGGGEALRRELLPGLLGVAELSALLLDLEFGWRTRVHDSRPSEATSSFVRSLAHVALEQATLPHVTLSA